MAQQSTTDSVLKEKEFEEGDDQADCPICLAKFNPKETICMLPCQHSYHHTCVEEWLREHSPTCPVCRHDVVLEGARAAAIQLHGHDTAMEEMEERLRHEIFTAMEEMEGRLRSAIVTTLEEIEERLRHANCVQMDENDKMLRADVKEMYTSDIFNEIEETHRPRMEYLEERLMRDTSTATKELVDRLMDDIDDEMEDMDEHFRTEMEEIDEMRRNAIEDMRWTEMDGRRQKMRCDILTDMEEMEDRLWDEIEEMDEMRMNDIFSEIEKQHRNDIVSI